MALFRKIHTSFWSDSFTSDLDKEKKLFYLYMLTNERTTQCGIYEITKRQISFDLGISIDTVSKLLEYFIKCGKIKYNYTTNELAIKNWLKYNGSTSPKVQSCINKELKLVKDTLLIQYLNTIDTHPQEEQEQEEEEEQQQENKVLTWREDFKLYMFNLNECTKELLNNTEWFLEREKFHPNLDIKLTMEKAYKDFWGTELGWKNKKASKSKFPDWKKTYNDSLTQKMNQVYKQRYGKEEINHIVD